MRLLVCNDAGMANASAFGIGPDRQGSFRDEGTGTCMSTCIIRFARAILRYLHMQTLDSPTGAKPQPPGPPPHHTPASSWLPPPLPPPVASYAIDMFTSFMFLHRAPLGPSLRATTIYFENFPPSPRFPGTPHIF